jgi:hypothetical protein
MPTAIFAILSGILGRKTPLLSSGYEKGVILWKYPDRREEWKNDHVIGLIENLGMPNGSSWILIWTLVQFVARN